MGLANFWKRQPTRQNAALPDMVLPTSGRPVIAALAGDLAGRIYPASTGGIMLGRDKVACRIVFPGDTRGVSRHHCIITYMPQAGLFIINDIGSTYGTFLIDGKRIDKGQPATLQAGSRFYLGSVKNLFEVRFD